MCCDRAADVTMPVSWIGRCGVQELSRLNKQVQEMSAAKSELESRLAAMEQTLRDRESAMVGACLLAAVHMVTCGAMTRAWCAIVAVLCIRAT
jgi:hypothetical protein